MSTLDEPDQVQALAEACYMEAVGRQYRNPASNSRTILVLDSYTVEDADPRLDDYGSPNVR